MIHLSYNGELYSYDNKTTTTVSSVTNIPVVIHPYVDIEGAKLYYKQDDVEGIVDIINNTANIPGAYLVTGDLQVALKLASDEMSNSFTIGVTVISSSGDIMDDDIQFTMDNKKRLILVPGYQTLLAIQFDNQSEIVTFKLPRYQEGVDLSTKVPYVNYRRPQVKDLGKALCTIEKTTEDSIYITWMVDATATQYDGVIQFQVEFADSEGYRWQSQIGEIPILASLYNTGLEPYTPDILEQYLGMMQGYVQQAAASAQEAREIEQSMEGKGLTEDFKQALLAIARKVAYIDDGGLTYYGWLYDALYPPVNLDSISALFQPGDTIINDSMSLDDLKQYLTVTAVYTDESTEELSDSDYSLSGSMTEGNQTITVSYGGKTTTFTVTVVEWLVSISAVFTQGSAIIYDTDSLDTLRQYLVVTATYADSTTVVVTDYTLSGTLEEGTSTITANYGDKSDTFTVDVSAGEWLYHFNQSIASSGSHDFGLTGVENYTDGVNAGDKCYYHHVTTEGDPTTDPLGLYALSSADRPTWSNNDFTISSWFKSGTNLRGYIFAQSHYVSTSSLTWDAAAVGNIASGWSVTKTTAYRSYSGLRLGYSSETLYLSITNADGSHGSNFKATPPNSFDSTQWHHYAVTRQGAILYIFVDGNIIFTITLSSTATIYSSSYITIGNWMNSGSTAKTVAPASFSSYHQDLYINIGNAKWTSAFDPTSIVY